MFFVATGTYYRQRYHYTFDDISYLNTSYLFQSQNCMFKNMNRKFGILFEISNAKPLKGKVGS